MSELAQRRLSPEILDDLAESDPRAVASRGDLRRLNVLMGNPWIIAGLLARHVEAPPRRILEIGAGDGAFMLRVARRLAKRWPKVELTLLDRQDLLTPERRAAFAAIGWSVEVLQADVFEGLAAAERFDAVTANLFLHHFDDAALRTLFERIASITPVFVATEPWRAGFPLMASRMLRVIGANDVTRHDAPASVRAGFRGRELSGLWPADAGFALEERRRGPFTQAFAAKAGTSP
ncbi:methyltransferase domain-containing protein [Aureimonas sp. AU12]|uniref:methyltransferase domain-containing protein n=1 Tax=Aureimonas sp. AU12 TaxID=1638161 RepID=UPI0007803634|nr:class I SAM-dependent methyltransferase [Aureimonas sp. AU12]